MPGWTAILLAGSRPGGDPLTRSLGVDYKPLLPIKGEPMLLRPIRALLAAPSVGDILVMTQQPERLADVVPANARLILRRSDDTIAATLQALCADPSTSFPLLVTTADHALLRPEWVRQLINGASPESDVAIMLAERHTVQAALPGSRRTYLRFADGHWSGCNLFLLRGPPARVAVTEWTRVEADRKRPWRIVARLGPGLLLRYLAGRLTLASALDRLGRRIGCRIALVPAADGLAAVDVDKPADLADVQRLIGR